MIEVLISLAVLFGFLFAGMVLARVPWVRRWRFLDRLTHWILLGLLLSMGFRAGRVVEDSTRLAEIGLISVGMAVGTLLGTFLCLALVFRLMWFFSKEGGHPCNSEVRALPRETGKAIAGGYLKEPLRFLVCVAVGYAGGVLLPYEEISGALASTWLLRLLLLSVGIDMARAQVDVKTVLSRKESWMVPGGTVIGTLAGGYVTGLFFAMDPNQSLSVAAGFGWYSLSGAIITDLGDPILGAVAFMSNIIRETIALVTIPLVAAGRFPNVAIGLGGATSMDVTLPVIERSCGPDAVPLAIGSGVVLSLLVPFLVPLFYRFDFFL